MGKLCDMCFKRDGELVCDEMMGPFRLPNGDVEEEFRFQYRMCRYCRAVETKRRKRTGFPKSGPVQIIE